MKIEFSSELMTNQKHATVMAPQDQFRVLQTQSSHVVTLSIGTDNVLYRVLEAPGTKAGWSRLDELSSLPPDFRGAEAKLFGIADNTSTAAVDIALAVKASGTDHLLIALDKPNVDASWDEPFAWVSIPFDDPSRSADGLVITGIYLLGNAQSRYMVVDVLEDPSAQPQLIERYFIDPTKRLSGRCWNRHPLPVSLQADGVSSRLGRKGGQLVDGIYTLGTLGGTVELSYSQIYNPFNPLHGNPLVSRFNLPAGAEDQETAFALGSRSDGTTDLYVAAAGSLFYLAADAQSDGATPSRLVTHPLLNGVTQLEADSHDGELVVWGMNRLGQVFCLRTAAGRQQEPGSWSTPVPLLSDALKLSSLLNRTVGGSVLFAHTSDDDLVQLTESAVTKLWAKRSIVLPPTDPKDMLTITTYTTHVQINGEDNLPLANQTVALRAAGPINVYVNNQYTQLFVDTQVEVVTDARGTLTILQGVKNLGGVAYYIDADGGSVTVNPMSKAMAILSGVKKGSDLDVDIPNSRGQTRPLVNAVITADQKNQTAQAIASFVDVSNNLPSDGSSVSVPADRSKLRAFDPARDRIFGMTFAGAPTAYFDTATAAVAAGVRLGGGAPAHAGTSGIRSSDDAIWAAAGDIYEWIAHAVDDVTQFFVQTVDDISTCFVEIAGELYRFVLDCVESVANGINFLLQKIEVLIDDLISWLGFLFEWPDIVRTHRVLKNLFKQFARYSVSELGTLKSDIENAFGTVEGEIQKWANLPAMASSASSVGTSNPAPSGSGTPQVHWGTYHLTGSSDSSQTSYTQALPETDALRNLLGQLVAALTTEEQIFSDTLSQLQTEVVDQFQTLTATQILEKVVAIVLEALIETIQNITVTTIDIIEILVEGVIDFLDAPIDVPIISQLYEQATEGDELSILDAVCLVVAIPTTILFKMADGVTPFPDDSFTDQLIDAPDMAAIRRLYGPAPAARPAESRPRTMQDGGELSTLERVCLFVSVPAAAVMTFTVPFRAQFGNNVPLAVIGTVAYLFYCAPDLPGLVENDRSKWYNGLNSAMTCVSLVKAMGDIGLTRFVPQPAGVVDTVNGACLQFWAKASPYVECAWNGLWFAPVIGAVIADHDEGGVMSCIANSGFNIGGMMALPLSMESPPVATAGLIGFLAGNTAYGYLNLIQAWGNIGASVGPAGPSGDVSMRPLAPAT